MHHEQTAGPGQRDIQLAQTLRGLLGVPRRDQRVPAHGAFSTHIEDSPTGAVVAADGTLVPRLAPVPRERHIGHGELQALTGVHGEHLHCLRIRLQAAGQLAGGFAFDLAGAADLVGQPVGQAHQAGARATVMGVQRAGHMA